MLGERIQLARKKAGLSLRALAEQIDNKVSAQAIGKYERGEMLPGSDVLIAMAEAVSMPLAFFLAQGGIRLNGMEFRKKAASTKKDLAAVQAAVLDSVERYLHVEEALGLPSDEWEKPAGFPYTVRSFDDAENAAESLRQDWELGVNPIPNMTELLEDHGIKVIMLDFPMTVDAMMCDVDREGQAAAKVIACKHYNKVSLERLRFSLAHELGHLVMDIDGEDEEKVCHRFAGAFLAPQKTLLREVGERRNSFGRDELIEVKRLFGISAAAFVVRLRDTGVISDSALTKVFCTIGRTWRKAEPSPIKCDECLEKPRRFERLCYRAVAEDHISLSKATELLRRNPDDIAERVWGEGA